MAAPPTTTPRQITARISIGSAVDIINKLERIPTMITMILAFLGPILLSTTPMIKLQGQAISAAARIMLVAMLISYPEAKSLGTIVIMEPLDISCSIPRGIARSHISFVPRTRFNVQGLASAMACSSAAIFFTSSSVILWSLSGL